jgi:hypothetical protein
MNYLLKPFIEFEGVTYYHYEMKGKWISNKNIVLNGVTYYSDYQ